jgi:hypothetical protein
MPQRNARFESEFSFDLLLVSSCDLVFYLLSVFSLLALIYSLRKSLGLKTCLSTFPLIPLLK